MTSIKQNNLASMPTEIKVQILAYVFEDAVTRLKGNRQNDGLATVLRAVSGPHETNLEAILASKASRKNILLASRAFFNDGIKLFYQLSRLDLTLNLTRLPNINALQNTRQMVLRGSQLLVPAVVILFPALRDIQLSPVILETPDSHVLSNLELAHPLFRTAWYWPVNFLTHRPGHPLTVRVPVMWRIKEYFPPGKAYNLVSTFQLAHHEADYPSTT